MCEEQWHGKWGWLYMCWLCWCNNDFVELLTFNVLISQYKHTTIRNAAELKCDLAHAVLCSEGIPAESCVDESAKCTELSPLSPLSPLR